MPGAAERALRDGAHGYVDKGEGIEGMEQAVRAVMSGYAAFPLTTLATVRRAAMILRSLRGGISCPVEHRRAGVELAPTGHAPSVIRSIRHNARRTMAVLE